jgi:hypothetical protein
MTLNQIIAKIRTQVESHKMVGKFSVGAEYNLAVDEVKFYPLVWLVPDGFDLATGENNQYVNYRFALLVFDRVFESESNTIEVLSDTAQIIIDIMALIDYHYNNNSDFQLVVSSTAEPFYDAKTDIVAGYGIQFQISTPYLADACVVPV